MEEVRGSIPRSDQFLCPNGGEGDETSVMAKFERLIVMWRGERSSGRILEIAESLRNFYERLLCALCIINNNNKQHVHSVYSFLYIILTIKSLWC